jgi:Ca2+-binding EF-hand superfamily protein/uncharacterized protein (DUF924 family)
MNKGLQDELIKFMFLRRLDGSLDVMACLKLWFGKSTETDVEIRTRFGHHVELALKGRYAHWRWTPRGCVALMILLDQFPRNMYRHTVEMYAGDEPGRAIVEAGHDWLKVLKPEECLFVPCLILTHQENVADQQACLRFWSKLEPLLPTELHVFRTIFEEHLRIVDLCGNFPHRDHYYGRTTSAVGKKLMDNPGLRFDLPLIAEGGHVRFGHDSKKLWDATQMTFNVVETLDAFVKNKVKRKNTIVTDWLTPEKAAECREGFRKFDKDGNGFLDREELVTVLQATGRTYTESEVQMAIDSITGTSGGTGLTFEQFAAVLQVKMTSDTQNRIRARFQLFDADNTGDISFEELTACLQGIDSLLTSSELTEMMKKCDTNGDGMISYEEFVGMVPTMMSPTSLDVNQSLWDIMSPVEPSSAIVGGFGWGDTKKRPDIRVRVNEVRVD